MACFAFPLYKLAYSLTRKLNNNAFLLQPFGFACNWLMPRRSADANARGVKTCNEKLAEIDEQLRKNKAKAEDIQSLRRIQQRKLRSVWKLSQFCINVVLILFHLGNATVIYNVPYLRSLETKKRWPTKTDEELAELAYNYFLAVDVEAYVTLTDIATSSDNAAMQHALRFKCEFDALQWCQGLNQGKGIAPPSIMILERFQDAQRLHAGHVLYANMHTPWSSNGRVIVHRWRSKHGGRYGQIRARKFLTEEEMRGKAFALILHDSCNRWPIVLLRETYQFMLSLSLHTSSSYFH